MLAMQRVGDPVVSPDGKLVAFSVRDTDVEANRDRFDIWLATIDGSPAEDPRHLVPRAEVQIVERVTTHPENDTDPQWSADGKWNYFVSTRSGSAQVWRIAPTGGEAEQVTKLPLDINGYKLFRDGKRIVLAIGAGDPGRLAGATRAKQEEALPLRRPDQTRIHDSVS